MKAAGGDQNCFPAFGQHWLMRFDPVRERSDRFINLIGTYLLALVLTIAPVLGAYATAGHDHTFGDHSLQVESSGGDHHTDDHNHNASSADDNATHSAADTLCCEDIGLCSVGFMLLLNDGKTSTPEGASYGLPGDVLPWHDHLGRPDGPPPRSHS